MPSATASKPRKARATAQVAPAGAQVDLPGLIAQLQTLQSQTQGLLKSAATPAPVQETNETDETPIIVKIPAGRNFQIIQVPVGTPASATGAALTPPSTLNPESFAQLLHQAANDLSTQELLGEAFSLAARRGVNICRFTAAANGVLYHSHNAWMKQMRESTGRTAARSRKKSVVAPAQPAVAPVAHTAPAAPKPAPAPAPTPAAAPELYPGMRQDVNLLRAHVKLAASTRKSVPATPESNAAFARLMRQYVNLMPDDRGVFENYSNLT